jgi:hypothetical protein
VCRMAFELAPVDKNVASHHEVNAASKLRVRLASD